MSFEEFSLDTENEFLPFDQWIEQEENEKTTPLFEDKIIPFRIGFELETGPLLSENIIKNHGVKKEPIFICIFDNKKLWHVEIDGADIEFVSIPISCFEEDLLKQCASGLQAAASILKQSINDHKHKLTFEKWVTKLKEIGFLIKTVNQYEKLKEEIIQWKFGKEDWTGFLQPHSTVQLPLEYVIELSFGLFREDQHISCIFDASLPFTSEESADKYFRNDEISKYNCLIDFRKPIDGLMFLHACTMFNLTLVSFISQTDSKSLKRLFLDFQNFHQITPKMYLQIMSRRSFSTMLQSIKLHEKYGNLFQTRMNNSKLFMNLDTFLNYYNNGRIYLSDIISIQNKGVQDLFINSCYGRVYWSNDLTIPQNLTKVFPLSIFKKEFVACDDSCLMKFLENGTLASVMLRNIKVKEQKKLGLDKVLSFTDYNSVVESVENPQWRPILKIRDQKLLIIQENQEMDEVKKNDFLSPPLFLAHNGPNIFKRDCDSMGSYYQSSEEINSTEFGEAIIEYRAISFSCREKLGIRKVQNGQVKLNIFLSEIEYLEKDIWMLFQYIKGKEWLQQ